MENDRLQSVWPEWRVVRTLGQGSFGTVYEIEHSEYQAKHSAAMKVISLPKHPNELYALRSEGMTEEQSLTYLKHVVDDFVAEIRLMESFRGAQNIVSVEDFKVVEKQDTVGWDIYIRMELLTPLSDYMTTHEMTEKDVVKLGCDICTALDVCARKNVIHRDIKPANIFVNQFGDFKLGDFGIAKKMEHVTGGLTKIGTPNYMAPEVIKGHGYDQSADLYSLGIVLYQLMNQMHLPFLDTQQKFVSPDERMKAIQRRVQGEPLMPPCEASMALSMVILKACHPSPSGRYASAAEMRAELADVLKAEPVIQNALHQDSYQQPGGQFYQDSYQQPGGQFYQDGYQQSGGQFYQDGYQQPGGQFYQDSYQQSGRQFYQDGYQQSGRQAYQNGYQTPNPPVYQAPAPEPQQPKKKPLQLIIGIEIGVLICVLAVLVIVLLSNRSKKVNVPEPKETEQAIETVQETESAETEETQTETESETEKQIEILKNDKTPDKDKADGDKQTVAPAKSDADLLLDKVGKAMASGDYTTMALIDGAGEANAIRDSLVDQGKKFYKYKYDSDRYAAMYLVNSQKYYFYYGYYDGNERSSGTIFLSDVNNDNYFKVAQGDFVNDQPKGIWQRDIYINGMNDYADYRITGPVVNGMYDGETDVRVYRNGKLYYGTGYPEMGTFEDRSFEWAATHNGEELRLNSPTCKLFAIAISDDGDIVDYQIDGGKVTVPGYEDNVR